MSKKSFNLQDDVLYTTSEISEKIKILQIDMGLEDVNFGTDLSPNIKQYFHWTSGSTTGSFYHGVFDRDSNDNRANHLIDVTFGASISSSLRLTPGGDPVGGREHKLRMYRQFAQLLLGNANKFFVFQGVQRDDLIFIRMDRNHYKDEIKRGTFAIDVIYSGNVETIYEQRRYSDISAQSIFDETVGGIRGFLTLTEDLTLGATTPVTSSEFTQHGGAVYYEAGTIVLIPEIVSFSSASFDNYWYESGAVQLFYEDATRQLMDTAITAMRQRIRNIEFRNQSNLRSTFYKCIAERDEFNYSPNPSFTNEVGIINTISGSDEFKSRTYISRVGLLGENDEVLAVGVLNRPVRKDPALKIEINVRLDY